MEFAVANEGIDIIHVQGNLFANFQSYGYKDEYGK